MSLARARKIITDAMETAVEELHKSLRPSHANREEELIAEAWELLCAFGGLEDDVAFIKFMKRYNKSRGKPTEHGYLLSEVRRTVRYRRVPLHGGTLGAKDRARRSKKEILQVWLCHAFQQWREKLWIRTTTEGKQEKPPQDEEVRT